MLKEFYFKYVKHTECWHPKITPLNSGDFCPDCGKSVGIFWVIVRCQCCHVKREAQPGIRTIIPVNKYCSKCGSKKYYTEKHYKLNFSDIHYAVLVKEELDNNNSPPKTQIWIENEDCWKKYVNPKLIPVLTE